uniref:Uncharacterized protein n=1 Tax=Zooxanthella nutricula TaxID=1333877 RepID=A0A6U6GWB9_9DINO
MPAPRPPLPNQAGLLGAQWISAAADAVAQPPGMRFKLGCVAALPFVGVFRLLGLLDAPLPALALAVVLGGAAHMVLSALGAAAGVAPTSTCAKFLDDAAPATAQRRCGCGRICSAAAGEPCPYSKDFWSDLDG